MKFWKPKSSKSDSHVLFKPLEIRAEIGDSATVLDVALSHKVPIHHECGGMGSCTTCRIFVHSDLSRLSPPTATELEITEGRGFAKNERLACQLTPHSEMVVEIPVSRKSK